METSGLNRDSSGELDPLKVGIGIIVVIILGLIFAYSRAPVNSPTENKPVVVATSTNLSYFAEEIGREEVEVHSIVQAGACPGHYQTSPGDVEAIANADLVLWNGMESWVKDLIDSSGNTDVTLNKSPAGPWGPPWGAKKYIENVTDALTLIFPQHKESFEERENQLISSIESCADNLKSRAMEENVGETKVICQQFQRGFVEWLGFKVVKSYPTPEQVSLSQISELEAIADNEDVALIISNKPSGTSVGETISESTNVEWVILSNFPGSREGESTYIKMIRNNADRLFSAKEAYES